MDLDPRTSSFFIGFINALSAITLVLFARLSPRYRGVNQWALANGTAVLGCMLLLFSGSKPEVYAVVAADILILFSLWLDWFGISLFVDRPRRGFSYLPALGVVSITLIYFALVRDPFRLQAIIFSIVAALVASASAYVLFRTETPHQRIAHWYSAGLFCLFALVMLVRAILLIGSSAGRGTWDLSGNPMFTFALGAVFVPLWTVGIALLVVERHTEELELRTTIDALTQMLNMEGAKLRIDQEAARARRSLKLFSILLVSIDHPPMNGNGRDRATGDAIMRFVGTALWEHVRFEDMVSRWGNWEFMLLLVGANAYQGQSVAQRICASIAQRSHASENERLQCTVSIGVASFDQASNVDHVVMLAEEALTHAKLHGGDQAAIAQPRTDLPPVPAQLRVGVKLPPRARSDPVESF